MNPTPLANDFIDHLKNQQHFKGDIRLDQISRILYSTDASIYQIEPLGIAIPRSIEDLSILIKASALHNVPILARGSGSSLAGQAIGPALIIDFTRYLNRIVHIDREAQTALVEPGVILNALNRATVPDNLLFGPDPASAERATIGGCIANNAAGAHSIVYGMTSDHILSLDVIFSDGSFATLEEKDLEEAEAIAAAGITIESKLYRKALEIRMREGDEIRRKWPETWRRASGYSLNYLLPWSATEPPQWRSNQAWSFIQSDLLPYPPVKPGKINLATLMAGSEGTLAIICRAKLRLVQKLRHTVLGILSFSSIVEACESVEAILAHDPSAVELIPQSLVQLAQSIPAYAGLTYPFRTFEINGNTPAAFLVVEFSGDEIGDLKSKIQAIDPGIWIAENPEAQKKVWDVRKVGLGILMSRTGNSKPVAFIEDTAVPVRHLGKFIREMEILFKEHGTAAEFYAHASAGCLHIRPILNLKTDQGVVDLREISERAADLTMQFRGAFSAEHGDGIARGEMLQKTYGDRLASAFREIKTTADPAGLLNPGKIVDTPPMDSNLRYGTDYYSSGWQPVFHFPESGSKQQEFGLTQAIEQCNGAGVCRKTDGVMCPSFQASGEEMHSTRGRANLLRAFTSQKFTDQVIGSQAVREALDLCLACKGCKSECPSGVDMARLKYEFFNQYYAGFKHLRRLRDYLFGYIGIVAEIGHPLAGIINLLLRNKAVKKFSEASIGLSSQRPFPTMSRQSLKTLWKSQSRKLSKSGFSEDVFFLSDPFTEYFQPEAGVAALSVLSAMGCKIHFLSTKGAGRTLISKGFLEAAKRHGQRLLHEIQARDPKGTMAIVGIEPSEIYTIRDEFLDIFSDVSAIRDIAARTFYLDEFLVRANKAGELRCGKLTFKDELSRQKVLFHGHCYQKAQPPAADGYPIGVAASLSILKTAGYSVELIDDGCCGMAGAFGYEKEHFEFSIKVGESKLFPAIRTGLQKDHTLELCTPGISCHSQIEDGTGLAPLHPAQLIARRLMD